MIGIRITIPSLWGKIKNLGSVKFVVPTNNYIIRIVDNALQATNLMVFVNKPELFVDKSIGKME